MEAEGSNTSVCHPNYLGTRSWFDVYETLKKKCRICGHSTDYLIPIFDGKEQQGLDQKIYTYLHVQVSKEDVLPLHICFECFSAISSWHTLFLNCQEANNKFRLMLDRVQLPSRHESVLMSPSKSSEHLYLSSNSYSQISLSTATQNTPPLEFGTDDPYPSLMSGKSHLNTNQSFAIQDIEPPPSAMLPENMLESFSGPHEEATDQDVFDIIVDSHISSNYTATLQNPANSGYFKVPHDVSANLPSELPSPEQQIKFLHVSTQTENVINDIYDAEYGTSLNQQGAVQGKKVYKQTTVLRKKRNFSLSESSLAKPEKPLEVEVPFQIPNRVSAIQSTSSTIFFHQDNACSRSKSVLVRNESVHPSMTTPEKNASNFTSPEMDTFIESAVIREHRNIGRIDGSGKGTMVSVVRPTCLRRAPTAVVVIENIDRKGDQEIYESIGKNIPKILPAAKRDHELFSVNHREFADANAGSPDVASLSSCQGEGKKQAKALDQSRICFHCKKFISNPVLLISHEKSHLSDLDLPTSFICKYCSSHHTTLSEMHLHYRVHESEIEKQLRSQCRRRIYLCKQCGLICATEERLAVHQRLHDRVQPWRHKCKTCEKTFNTRNKLRIHLWTHTLRPTPNTSRCHIRGAGFRTRSTVIDHCLKYTKEQKMSAYKCTICNMAFGSNSLLGRHRSTHTSEEVARPFKCTFCSKAFARNHTLQIHYLSHSDEKSHVCNQCGKGFKMRNSLIQHMRTHQDPSALPIYPCNICEKAFKVKSRLRDHLRLHNGDKPYECATCQRRFHKVTALHTHEISHTDRRPFMCDVCGKAFKWSKNLRQHETVHLSTGTADKVKAPKDDPSTTSGTQLKSKQTCRCELCGKQLCAKSSLKQHMITVHRSEGTRPLKSTICSTCGKELSSSGGLVRHMKLTHGGVKAFKCDICSKEYSTKVARDDHRRSHTGERPYSCSVCSKAFTSLSNLHIHKATHSEDRPHKCSYCDKQFKRRAHLIPHIRTHTGEKPYVCSICSRGFAQSNDLHKHRLTHSQDKAYNCHCGMAYRIKRDLVRHQTKHHPCTQGFSEPLPVGIQMSSAINETPKCIPKHQVIVVPGQQSSISSCSASASRSSAPHLSHFNVISSVITTSKSEACLVE